FERLYVRGTRLTVALGMIGASLRRLGDVANAGSFDVVLVQREAMLLGPPWFEAFVRSAWNRPLVLDLDDATYLPYRSPTYGRLGSALKCFGKTDRLISWADVVICGNDAIAEYVVAKGKRAVVLPTVVDTDVFRPREGPSPPAAKPVLGWVGSHSTFP